MVRGSWCAARLGQGSTEVLLAQTDGAGSDVAATLSTLAEIISAALDAVRRRQRQQSQVQRLETMLKISSSWRQTQETDILLQEMAEASTRLLKAERASIFLW